jgi:hypothetical protein
MAHKESILVTIVATFLAQGEEPAAVVVEPIMGNVASILADRAWLYRVRELCTQYGVVLIFDEVKTGFRLARRGAGILRHPRRPGGLCQGDGQRLPSLGSGRPRRYHGHGSTTTRASRGSFPTATMRR